jgi:NTE family protein
MQALYQKGYDAAEAFLSTWNFKQYLQRYRRPV